MYQTRVESLLCTQPCARPQGSSSDCGLSRNGSQWQGQTRIQDPVPYTHRASSRVGQGSPYSSYFPPPDLMGHETIWGHWSLPAMNMRNSRGTGDLIWYQKQNRKPQCSQCISGPTTLYLPRGQSATHSCKLITTNLALPLPTLLCSTELPPGWFSQSLQRSCTWCSSCCLGKGPESSQVKAWAHQGLPGK